ncbi:Hemolymph lipopolysaccharide-binding protein [Gryllus bimaculatus]|nr:Hemolymph lipopolysaccharide-binding protein [Gryllus bimaculatus]
MGGAMKMRPKPTVSEVSLRRCEAESRRIQSAIWALSSEGTQRCNRLRRGRMRATDVVLPTSKGRKSKSSEEFGLEVTQSDCSTPTANYVRLTTELIVPERRVPPPEYQLVPGVGWYRLYLAPLTWGKARLACEADGAHLAVLNSKKEAAALKEIYVKAPGSTPTDAFIGFSDLIEGQYRTIFGDTLEDAGFKEWHTQQPNNYGGNQNCGAFTKGEGKLNDWDCAGTQPYFCEFEL